MCENCNIEVETNAAHIIEVSLKMAYEVQAETCQRTKQQINNAVQ